MCCLLCRLYSKAMAITRGNERMFAGRVLWAMFCGPRSVVCVRSGVPICREFPSHYLVGCSPAICISDRQAGSSLTGCYLTGLSLTMSRLIGVSGFIDTPFGSGGKAMRWGVPLRRASRFCSLLTLAFAPATRVSWALERHGSRYAATGSLGALDASSS